MIGKQLKNYKLLEVIGTGGMSTVYLGRDINTGRLSAVKILKKQYTQENDHIERFFTRQIKLTGDLDHPNIVRLLDYGKSGETYFLVYELIQGISLDKHLKKHKLSLARIESISLQILSGLSYAHQKGLVHRDIKPQNILITPEGIAKITDFGIARALSSSTITRTGMFIGSPGYVSPEQADGKKVDTTSDLYSFGVVLFEMLARKLPFTSDTPWGIVNKHINEAPPDISKIVKDIPAYLSYIVAKCLVKSPHGRFSTADEIIDVLKSKSYASETVIKDVRDYKPQKEYSIAPPPKKESSSMKKVGIAVGAVVVFFIIISIIISIAGRANRGIVDDYGTTEETAAEEMAPAEEEAVEEAEDSDEIVLPLGKSYNSNLLFEDTNIWSINWYRPNTVDLVPSPLNSNIVEPIYSGEEQFYGLINLVGNEFNIVLDKANSYQDYLFIDFNLNLDFSDEEPILLKGDEYKQTESVQFILNYNENNEKYNLLFYYSENFNIEVDAFRFHYYRDSIRVGKIELMGENYIIGILDENANGVFNDYEEDVLFFDFNNDKQLNIFEESGEIIDPMRSPICIDEYCYQITDISDDGSYVELTETPKGTIEGFVVEKDTGLGISNAKVTIYPGELTIETNKEGYYQTEICPGTYFEIRATHPDFILEEKNNYELDGFILKRGELFRVNFELDKIQKDQLQGELVLYDGDSYHFLSGQKDKHTGGDFYFGFYDSKPSFWANNMYQRGLLDLGDIGNVDLGEASIPEKGYYEFGVTAIVGHTYISLAREGEEGHFIVFRVLEINANSFIRLEYVYR